MSHTPGPWIWRDEERGLSGNGAEVLRWEPYEGMWLSWENTEDNARLIAAAPELLEALQRVVKFWDSITMENRVNDLHDSARAAIAKATTK